MRFLILTLMMTTILLAACDAAKKGDDTTAPKVAPVYRYFDREIHFARGSSVAPEQSAAQEVIKAALEDLEKNTDLGAGYFSFAYEDDSLLQPLATRTAQSGRNWKSFIQTWDDALINDLFGQLGTENPDGDQDTIVARNGLNPQQYFMVTRLSCFLAGASCGFASQTQAKMLVWRSFGYLIGMRIGSNASSAVMQTGQTAAQENPDEQRKFIAEFNSRLETIKNTNMTGVK